MMRLTVAEVRLLHERITMLEKAWNAQQARIAELETENAILKHHIMSLIGITAEELQVAMEEAKQNPVRHSLEDVKRWLGREKP